jgi:hypothetical protein
MNQQTHDIGIYTVIIHQNTENPYMFRSLWDDHQGVCTWNDLVQNINQLINKMLISGNLYVV